MFLDSHYKRSGNSYEEQIKHAKRRAKLNNKTLFVFRNGNGGHWMASSIDAKDMYCHKNTHVATVFSNGEIQTIEG